jgi:hypothetical protein
MALLDAAWIPHLPILILSARFKAAFRFCFSPNFRSLSSPSKLYSSSSSSPSIRSDSSFSVMLSPISEGFSSSNSFSSSSSGYIGELIGLAGTFTSLFLIVDLAEPLVAGAVTGVSLALACPCLKAPVFARTALAFSVSCKNLMSKGNQEDRHYSKESLLSTYLLRYSNLLTCCVCSIF